MSLRGLSCLFFICFIGIGNAQKLIRPEPPKCQHLKKEGGENYASGDGGLDPNTMCNLHKKYSTPYTNCLCNWEKEHNAYEKQVKETRARIKVIKEANTLLQKEQRDISTTFNRSYVDLSSLKDESLFNREKNHQIKFYRKLISLEKKKKTTFFLMQKLQDNPPDDREVFQREIDWLEKEIDKIANQNYVSEKSGTLVLDNNIMFKNSNKSNNKNSKRSNSTGNDIGIDNVTKNYNKKPNNKIPEYGTRSSRTSSSKSTSSKATQKQKEYEAFKKSDAERKRQLEAFNKKIAEENRKFREEQRKQYLEQQKRQQVTNVAANQIATGDYISASYTFSNAGMTNEAFATLGIGVATSILADLKKAKMEKIKSRSNAFKSGLRSLSMMDQELRTLYKNKQYYDFLKRDADLRKKENSMLVDGDWLRRKTDNASFSAITKEIEDKQLQRMKIVNMVHNMFIKAAKSLGDMMNLIYVFEEKEERIHYDARTHKAKTPFYLSILFKNNRLKRDEEILNENLQSGKYFKDDFEEAAFYVRSSFKNDYFDGKVKNYFKGSSKEIREKLMKWSLYRAVKKGEPVPSNITIQQSYFYKNAKFNTHKIELLLEDGNGANYYADFDRIGFVNQKTDPMHQFVSSMYNGYNKTLAHEKIKKWIKEDKKYSGLSRKDLYQERKDCYAPRCNDPRDTITITKFDPSKKKNFFGNIFKKKDSTKEGKIDKLFNAVFKKKDSATRRKLDSIRAKKKADKKAKKEREREKRAYLKRVKDSLKKVN